MNGPKKYMHACILIYFLKGCQDCWGKWCEEIYL